MDQTTLDINDELFSDGNQSEDYNFDGRNLDGQLTGAVPELLQGQSYNQLDEPILDTLMRDLTGIYSKMKIIALPLSSYDIYKIVLRGWDLWGPLLLCTFLAFSLHHDDSKDNRPGPHFADIFVLIWFGTCIVSLNYRLLSISCASLPELTSQDRPVGEGGDEKPPSIQETTFRTLLAPPSMFQLMCVFGYCLGGPCFGLILLKIFSFSRLFFERIIIGLLFGFAWPTFCSMRILVRYQHPDKRALAIYPVALFYFVLSCMIILDH